LWKKKITKQILSSQDTAAQKKPVGVVTLSDLCNRKLEFKITWKIQRSIEGKHDGELKGELHKHAYCVGSTEVLRTEKKYICNMYTMFWEHNIYFFLWMTCDSKLPITQKRQCRGQCGERRRATLLLAPIAVYNMFQFFVGSWFVFLFNLLIGYQNVHGII